MMIPIIIIIMLLVVVVVAHKQRYVEHGFLHMPVLRARISRAIESGLDKNMEAFTVADALRARMEYDSALAGTELELAVAQFPFEPDPVAATSLKRSAQRARRLQQQGEIELRDEDADLLALADRCVRACARAYAYACVILLCCVYSPVCLLRCVRVCVRYSVV
jgi:hypothetical protein